MQGMTMEFHVKNPETLKDITRNDLVDVELTVTNEDEYISKVTKTGHDAAADSDDKANVKDNSGSMLMEGQPVPNFDLVNQDNHSVKLSDFQGKPVVITFIYTRCPFPDMCPRLTHNFAAIQKQLAPKYGSRFQLISISVDPANDTPAVLKNFAKTEGADLSIWSFLTGKDEQIKKIAGNFGVDYWSEGTVVNHSMASAVIKPDGTLLKVYRHADWNPDDVVADISHILN
jgi:protein SCO1/2